VNKQSDSLQIRRISKHARAHVFSALTEPTKMAQWFFGMKAGRAKVTSDLRPGGKYVIEMSDDEQSCSPHGTYLEITPPERLVFTWSSKEREADSTVTIELFEHEGGTELVLTHELPRDKIEDHQQGWNNCLDHLEQFLDASAPNPLSPKRKH
jgi:uncharacterized protein YndB with AHSA1/START domain